MKRILLSLVALVVAAASSAQYHVDFQNSKYVLTAAAVTGTTDDDGAFANLVLWAQDAVKQPGNDFFTTLDYEQHTLTLPLTAAVEKAEFHTNLTASVTGGALVFTVTDIVQETKAVLGSKRTPFEWLKPDTKPAHKEIINTFESAMSALINSMVTFTKTNTLPRITHWNEIRAKRIVEGMNETECLLALGRPRIVTDGEERQWLMNGNVYVFFKKDIVTNVVK